MDASNTKASRISCAMSNTVPWPVFIFIISIVIPLEVSIDILGLFVTVNRAVLILLIFPLVRTIVFDKSFRLALYDYLLIFYAIWMIISLSYHYGFLKGLESGGIMAVESLCAYFIARCYVTKIETFIKTINILSMIVVVIACVSFLETLTGKHIVHDLFGAITGYEYNIKTETRLGLTRAFGPMNHPILLGVFCSSILAMVWCNARITKRKKRPSIYALIGIVLGTFSSLSSAPLLLLLFQSIALIYDKLFRVLKHRWAIAFVLFLLLWSIIDQLSNRSPLHVLFSYLTINPQTGYMRTYIWDYASQEVLRYPLLGIGFNEWYRPEWMSPSIDNFWLVNAVRYGLPSLIGLSGSILVLVYRLSKAKNISNSEILRNLRFGWLLSFLSMCLVAATVHLWNTSYVYFFFIFGLSSWMLRRDV